MKKIIILSFIIFLFACDEKSNSEQLKEPIKKIIEKNEIKTEKNLTKLSKEDLLKHKPNEMGMIMILEYHRFGPKEERWTRTPPNFRKDLERLYKEGYYLTPLRDVINNRIKTPLGKTPVVLTFDDGSEGQFRYLKKGEDKIIDPDSAIGIIEDFTKKHPDFGKSGSFYVLPKLSFGQTFADSLEKLKFLNENGYEIGNHTIDHSALGELNDKKVIEKIGEHVQMIQKIIPGYQVNTVAYPYGSVPKNINVLKQGEFKGTKYQNIGGLLVGAEPAFSPNSKKFKPFYLPRIQAIQSELERYLPFFAKNPGYKYISDGNENTITIPSKLSPGLENTISDKVLSNPSLIRY